ncbi:gibberellin-regulated protein 1-like [Lotus japonicus]|uniref:gibberellin-regulated protein 1-like n=1 Tax=Lotus japonicus TaxID=34305 RepID=UPI0025889712|nr:gibberellin-regulated protein 1-like [Lotus japonicus]
MAISKTLFAPILISLILLHLVESNARMDNTMVESPSPSPSSSIMDCGSACDERCKLSSRPNLCKRACGTCCERCNCVPSGTYGHYEECACYANMTTHGGRRKCP